MKELQDYIHLYLRCRAKTTGGKYGKIVSVSVDGTAIIVYDNEDPRGFVIAIGALILILRPLESITEEEAKQYARLKGYKDDYIQNLKFINKGFEFGNGDSMTFLCLVPPYGDQHKPNQFIWLLSKGFDLFNLKDAGLAVYE